MVPRATAGTSATATTRATARPPPSASRHPRRAIPAARRLEKLLRAAIHEVPAPYVLSPCAPAPRTLVDILYDTAARYPEATAIDDGDVQLTYSELISDIEDSVEWLGARADRRGAPGGSRVAA